MPSVVANLPSSARWRASPTPTRTVLSSIMHSIQIYWILDDRHFGSVFEGTRQFVEPAHLAAGQFSGTLGYTGLRFVEGYLSGEVSDQLPHADGVRDRGVDPRSHLFELRCLFEAFAHDPLRALRDSSVQRPRVRAQVDQGRLVTEFPFPDGAPVRDPRELQLLRPRSAPGVGRARGDLRRHPPRSRVHLRREGHLEEDSVQVHSRPGIEHERRLRPADDLLRARLVPGHSPFLRDGDDADELGRTAAGVVGYDG